MTTHYKIAIEYPDHRAGYWVTDSLEVHRGIAREHWRKLEGCLDDPWSQVLGIQRPETLAFDDDATDQLTGAFNAWSSYLLDNLTPEQVVMIWAHDGGSVTIEEVQV